VTDQLRKSMVHESASLRDAMRSLEDSMAQIVLVVDDDDRLTGVLTDGDIRRAILADHPVDSPLAPHVIHDPFTVSPGVNRVDVLELMQARQIAQLPMVDHQRRVVGLHLMQQLLATVERPNWAVVMAGGRGSRLGELTRAVPKPMLLVAGKPILERIVLQLVGSGVRRIFLSVGYLGEIIEQHFGDGRQFGCEIDYLRESEPLGTAGSLALLPQGEKGPDQPMLVMNGDLVTQANLGGLIDAHERGGQAATMAVRQFIEQIPFGCVDVDGDELVGFAEKPTTARLINAGMYVIEPAYLELVDSAPITMPELLGRIQAKGGRVRVVEMDDDWIDVGRRDQLDEARGER
jgi:dTDP-glucose pyrophosphorylase/predicted transcriptional regulator